ncbi:hypothetical protein PR048_024011 [Dryococelus australis]|uniref:Uncharacterized protein n=1 Tax=Dryococelus australis TaxID=614101 RepID=A0ABQ9GVP4_9NEOP|nr:hypothetical protein PR048_024011 [Dryococelus australis]
MTEILYVCLENVLSWFTAHERVNHLHPVKLAIVGLPHLWPVLKVFMFTWGRGGVVDRLLVSHPGQPGSIPSGVTPAFSCVGLMLDDATGWRVSSGISRFPHAPSFRAPLRTRIASPSSALKNPMLRPAQIPSLTHSCSPHWSTRCLTWRMLTKSSPSTMRADIQCVVDMDIFVHKTVETSLQRTREDKTTPLPALDESIYLEDSGRKVVNPSSNMQQHSLREVDGSKLVHRHISGNKDLPERLITFPGNTLSFASRCCYGGRRHLPRVSRFRSRQFCLIDHERLVDADAGHRSKSVNINSVRELSQRFYGGDIYQRASEVSQCVNGKKLIASQPGRNRGQSSAGPLRIFAKWESCQTLALVGEFSRGPPAFPRSYIPGCSPLFPNVRDAMTIHNSRGERSPLYKTTKHYSPIRRLAARLRDEQFDVGHLWSRGSGNIRKLLDKCLLKHVQRPAMGPALIDLLVS